ncbi:hypothetical protein OHS70_00490 [Streptomyces sp. NBC_00390]
MLAIAAAVFFFIAFLINAAEIATDEVFSSRNVMLLGLALLALHVAGDRNRLAIRPGPPTLTASLEAHGVS